MIVVNYNTSDDHGGAAKAANRLNTALTNAGVNAFMACRHKQTRSRHSTRIIERRSEIAPRLKAFEAFWTDSARQFLISENRTPMSSTIFTIDPFGLDVTEAPISSIARIHHLHWCSSFISPSSVLKLKRTGRPVFITLHDQWWMTGGCHYSAGCNAYQTACTDCPQLRADPASLVAAAFDEKKATYGDGDITIVAPSQWMADCAARSEIFRNADINVVRNPFALDVFRPLPKDARQDFRANLGLENGDIALLFGAQKTSDRRKGGAVLIEAMKRVRREIANRVVLVTFGKPGGHELNATGVPIIELGEIFDEAKLAEAYASADLFIAPSLEDNYPNTVVESLACGTPVIGFAAGGLKDLVDGEITGLLAEPVGDAGALAEAIVAGIEKFTGREALREECRKAVEAPHEMSAIAAQMIALYERKSPDFRADITREETLVMRETMQRNRAGTPALARLDISPSLFENEELLKILAPLQALYEKASADRASAAAETDLTLLPEQAYFCGRGQHGARYLGAGWSAPYFDGAWNAQETAHINFHLPEKTRMNAVILDVTGAKGAAQTLHAAVNQHRASVLSIADDARQKIRISTPDLDGPCYVTLKLRLTSNAGAGKNPAPAPAKSLFLKGLSTVYEAPQNKPVFDVIDTFGKIKSFAQRLRNTAQTS